MNRPDGSRLETTVIGINQARAYIGGGKYDPKTKPAASAYAWKHGQLVSILLEKGAYLRSEEKGAPPIGATTRWKLTKGKAGTHDGKKGDFNFYFLEKHDPVFWSDVEAHWMGGVDIWTDAANEGKRLGLVQASGAWLQWRDIRAQGAPNFAQALAEAEAEVQKLYWDDCHKAANVIVRYV